MKNALVLTLVLIVLGCESSRNYIPQSAFKDSVQTVSIPHPYQQELRGVRKIVSFEVVIDPGQLVGGGFGVYPSKARKVDGEIVHGYVVIAPNNENYLPMTRKCDILGRVFFEASLQDLKNARILVFSNDMGWAYTLKGEEIPLANNKKQLEEAYYDPKEYDEDVEYQKRLFESHGLTMELLHDWWQVYYAKMNEEFRESVFEVEVGSAEWADYKNELMKILPKVYHMPMGEYRIGFLSEEEFREKASELADSNVALRLFKRIGLPLGVIGVSFTAAGAVAPAASFAGQVVDAFIDDEQRHSFSARAFAMRHDLAQTTRLVLKSCQNVKDN